MRDKRGSVALEFAFIAPPLLLLIMGIMDIGHYYFTAESLRSLVATAARAEIIADQPVGCSNPSTQLLENIPFLRIEEVILCVNRATDSGVSMTTISASYPFTSITKVFTPSGGRITDDITMTK
jgi:hypothetical protein